MDNEDANISVGSRSIMLERPAGSTTEPKRLSPFEESQELEYWGLDNLEPRDLLEEISENSILNDALSWKVKALYSGGLQYGYSDGEEFTPAKIPQIEAMLRASNTPFQLLRGLSGLGFLGNAFPELILSKDRGAVAKVGFPDSSFCRWSKRKAGSGSSHCLISAAWDIHPATVDSAYVTKVPAVTLDAVGMEAEWIREASGHKFILPQICLPTLGRSRYAYPQWAGIRKTGWLEYAKQIPKFKEAYLKNASHIKYAIHVPESWWYWKYPDWEALSKQEKADLRRQEHERFDRYLTGYENAGRSILMTFRDSPEFQQNQYTKWDIQILDKKVIEGILTDDVLETTQMIHHAVGVHGTLLGSSPGSKLGAGSGSDQKQAYNIFIGLSQAEQDILMRPYEIAAEYSGYPNLKFRFRNRLIADLKDITPSKREPQDAI